MKTRSKIVALLFLMMASLLVATLILFPQIAATQYGYFDIHNGRVKLEWVSFGRVYRHSTEDTEYSKLLTNLGFKEIPPNWKLATLEQVGLRRFFPPQCVYYHQGAIEVQSRMFASLVVIKHLDEAKARELVEHFRVLIQSGNSSEVRQYVSLLSQEK